MKLALRNEKSVSSGGGRREEVAQRRVDGGGQRNIPSPEKSKDKGTDQNMSSPPTPGNKACPRSSSPLATAFSFLTHWIILQPLIHNKSHCPQVVGPR